MAVAFVKESYLKAAIGEDLYSQLYNAIKDNVGSYIDDRWYCSTDDIVWDTMTVVCKILKPVIERSG